MDRNFVSRQIVRPSWCRDESIKVWLASFWDREVEEAFRIGDLWGPTWKEEGTARWVSERYVVLKKKRSKSESWMSGSDHIGLLKLEVG